MKVLVITRQPSVAEKFTAALSPHFEVETHHFLNGYAQTPGQWLAVIDWCLIDEYKLGSLAKKPQIFIYETTRSPKIERAVVKEGLAGYLTGTPDANPILTKSKTLPNTNHVQYKDLTLIENKGVLLVGQARVELKQSEVDALKKLISANGEPIGVGAIESADITRIRRKIAAAAPGRNPIRTKHSYGYHLD